IPLDKTSHGGIHLTYTRGEEPTMSTNTDLTDWEQELLQNCDEQLIRAAEHHAQELCQGCYGTGPLRMWPLAPRRPVCDGCWLHLVRGDVQTRPAGRRGLQVWTTHPQRGELLRGTVRAVGIQHRELRPATRWALAD